MALFKKKGESIVVVDIRSSSIGAAYVVLQEGVAPFIVHSVRYSIDPHATEPAEETFPRTLDAVLSQLITEGGPLLHAQTGSGSIDRIYATLTAPWQDSTVHSVVIEHEKPFIFSHQVLHEATVKSEPVAEGYEKVSEMIIATLLNGYEVDTPFGKRVKRAELVVLSSSIQSAIMDEVRQKLRKAFHQHNISFHAFMPEAYGVMRDHYPHQRDFLVLDVGNEATDVLLAKHGILISILCMQHGVAEMARAARGHGLSNPALPTTAEGNTIDLSRSPGFASTVEEAEATWIVEMKHSLAEIATHEPLPRTIFLLAEENVRDFLRNLLDAPELRALWLTEESIAIMPLLPAQFVPFVGIAEGSVPDPALALLSLAAKRKV